MPDQLVDTTITDADENGIEGVVINLFTSADGDGQPDDLDGDGVPDPVKTVTTDVDGFYNFEGLLPGTYVVGVPAENFVDGAPLGDMTSSTPTTADPEDDQDSDDNGIDPAELGDPVYSLPIVLAANSEPTNDDPPASGFGGLDDDSNLTIDFGFFQIPASGGAVWDDADRDGEYDASESGLADIGASLIDSDGNCWKSPTPRTRLALSEVRPQMWADFAFSGTLTAVSRPGGRGLRKLGLRKVGAP